MPDWAAQLLTNVVLPYPAGATTIASGRCRSSAV